MAERMVDAERMGAEVRPRRSRGLRASVALWLSLCSALLGVSCTRASSALEDIRERGFLRVGYSEEPPYAFLDASGTVVGESPGALRGALREVGVDSVRWIRFDFEDLIPELVAGSVDVVASGLFSTAGRAELVRFSRPTTCTRPALLTRVGSPPLSGLRDFREPDGGDLAVLAGSVEQEAARALGISDTRLVVVPDVSTGVVAVRTERARGLALSLPSARRAARSTNDLEWRPYEPMGDIAELVGGCSALVVRKTDTTLSRALDRGLDAFVGSDAHLSLLEALGFTEGDLPQRASGVGR